MSCGGLHYKKSIDGELVHDHIHAFDPNSLTSSDGLEHADVLRFGSQGPQKYLFGLPSGTLRETSDLVVMPFTHVLHLYLDPVIPLGTTRSGLKHKISTVLRHSGGWARAGVWMAFTEDPTALDTETDKGRYCTVKVKPYGDTTCGNQWTSCAHIWHQIWGQVNTWRISVDLKLAHMDGSTPLAKAGGPNHEIGGHIGFGACDMYRFENEAGYSSAYGGVMDAGADSTPWPTDEDIAEAQAKMRGEARYPQCGYPAKAAL